MRPKPYLAPPFYPAAATAGEPGVRTVPVTAYYQVRNYTCGFASVLTVLHSYRRYVDPGDLYDRLGTDRHGTSQSAIVRELRAASVGVTLRYDLDFEDVAREIDRGRLIIGYHSRLEHWVVVYGYGRDPRRVLVADPLPGMRTEHLWSHYGPRMNGFGIVCSRRSRRASAQPVAPLSAP